MTLVRDLATLDAVDAERSRLFALLGHLLGAAPDAAMLRRLAGLRSDGSEIGEATGAMAASAALPAETVEREFFDLFIGVGRGEILPYASYYLTGFLHERPLADLRQDLVRLGIERAPGVVEPEDHLAFLCEIYGDLLAQDTEAAARIFDRHMRPWAGRCFADLEKAASAHFYQSVGRLGRLAIEFEAAAADLPA